MALTPRFPFSRRAALAALLAGTALAAAPVVVAVPSPAAPATGDPQAVVRQFYDTLLSVMREGPDLGFQGRFDRLRPAFEAAFDVPFMTRVVAGPEWRSFSDAERRRLAEAFTRFSVASYARSFRAFDGEVFEIQGTRPYPQGLMVQTRIVPAGQKPVALNYLMRQEDGRWGIFDVFLDGTISQLATRRSDFAATLRDQGPEGLARQLDAKTDELAEGP